MKKFILILFCIFIITSKVLAMGFEQASKQNKPILLLFIMTGCSACKHYEPDFDKFSARYADKFVVAKENVSFSFSNIAARLGVQGVPALFIIEPQKHDAYKMNYDCMWDQACFEKTLTDYK